jgi:predicted transposase/invertase (TIGR01784 family)
MLLYIGKIYEKITGAKDLYREQRIPLHLREVMNMLLTEWNWDDALAVREQEGEARGRQEGKFDVVRNTLAKGLPITTISEITGLDEETITTLGS